MKLKVNVSKKRPQIAIKIFVLHNPILKNRYLSEDGKGSIDRRLQVGFLSKMNSSESSFPKRTQASPYSMEIP